MTRFQKIARVYRDVALYSFNTLLLFLIVVGGVFLVSKSRNQEEPENPISKYGMAKLQSVYPERSSAEIAALLDENWGRPLIYEPYTQFTEAPFHGRYVNIADGGYRLIENQGPWPPDKQNLNIFVFGGSTTFGYGVADSETIPSALQKKLRLSSSKRVCVYNFGRAHYYSTQERILFSNLLVSGIAPDVAVFIDGLNEFYYRKDAPEYSSQLMRVLNENFHVRKKPLEEPTISDIVRKLPDRNARDGATGTEVARAICQRYLSNRQLIESMAQARNIKTLFVWQPVPTYKFDLKYHPFQKDFGRHLFSRIGYEQMAEFAAHECAINKRVVAGGHARERA